MTHYLLTIEQLDPASTILHAIAAVLSLLVHLCDEVTLRAQKLVTLKLLL